MHREVEWDQGSPFSNPPGNTGPGSALERWKGAVAETVLGKLRVEHEHALRHQRRVGREWDDTLKLLGQVDFHDVQPGWQVDSMRGMVEIWHDLTLEPPKRISSHGQDLGLASDPEERYEYLHRVFVGREPAVYLMLCDEAEEELKAIAEGEGGTVSVPELRDRLVELMELGVRSSTRALDWLSMRIREAEAEG